MDYCKSHTKFNFIFTWIVFADVNTGENMKNITVVIYIQIIWIAFIFYQYLYATSIITMRHIFNNAHIHICVSHRKNIDIMKMRRNCNTCMDIIFLQLMSEKKIIRKYK